MVLKSFIAVVAVSMLAVVSGSDDQPKLDGVKCPLMGKNAVKAEKTVDYRGGKVYFCCDRCVKGFKADDATHTTKANHQLALTGQFTQKACPMTGKPVADGKTVDVGGVSVGVCCDGCKGKLEKAEGVEGKAKLVFANEAFDKGFETKKAEK